MQKEGSESKNNEESNKENISNAKRHFTTLSAPTNTQINTDTKPQQAEELRTSFGLGEKILAEIHHDRNSSKVLSQHSNIPRIVSLKHQVFQNNSKIIRKSPIRISKKNIQKGKSKQQASIKRVTDNPPDIVPTKVRIPQVYQGSIKTVEIRPMLRKFICNSTDSLLVSTTEFLNIESNRPEMADNQLNLQKYDKLKLDESVKNLPNKYNDCNEVEDNGQGTEYTKNEVPFMKMSSIEAGENNENDVKKESPFISPLSMFDIEKCESTEKPFKDLDNLYVNAFEIIPKRWELRKSTINSKKIINSFPNDSKDSYKLHKRKSPKIIKTKSNNQNELIQMHSSARSISSFLDIHKCESPGNIPNKHFDMPDEVIIKKQNQYHHSSNSSSDDDYNSKDTTKSIIHKHRKAGAIYGTISQLISEEEKETIEKYYTVNMSVVDSKKVEASLKYLNKKQTMCNICNTIYPRMDKCRVHIWGHLEMKPYKCKACNFATVTVTNIRCHIRKSHLKIKPFECTFCKKRYVTAVLLDEHLNTHNGLRPYKCKICEFSSASRQVLSYHMTTHKTVKDVTCDICGKDFFSKGRMRAHMITHNKNKELMCKYCSHHFSNSAALNKHYENAHSKDYICDICGKATKSRKALHNHQNVHSEAKFKCTLCPNVYKSGHILKEHLLKHEGIRKYKCEVCEKDFAQQSHLAAHMAVHSEKRFKCPGCQRAFNRHDNMKIHTKRCTLFNANPGLKDLINQRVKKASTIGEKENKPAMNNNKTENEEKSDNKQQKSREVLDNEQKIGANDDINMDESEAFRIGQIMVVPIPSVPVNVDCQSNGAINVTESILSLECF